LGRFPFGKVKGLGIKKFGMVFVLLSILQKGEKKYGNKNKNTIIYDRIVFF
jgi:hypothetical protein